MGAPRSRIVPLLVGAAAVAASAYYLSNRNKNVPKMNPTLFTGNGQWIDLPIKKIVQETADTKRFFFKLPAGIESSGLTLTSAVMLKFVSQDGSEVMRPYTPVNDISDNNEMELLIKHYPEGKMTTHLFGLKPDDTVSFKGPLKKWNWQQNSFDTIVLLGGGTGITPLYQLIYHLTKNPDERTKIKLFYGNKTSKDILLRAELDALREKYPERLQIVYFLDKANDDPTLYDAQTGYITKSFLEENMPKPNENVHVFVCGPPPFMNSLSGPKISPADQGELTGILREMGYSKDQVFKF